MKNLSDLIIELTILLEPVEAQIKILKELSSAEMLSVMMQQDDQAARSEKDRIIERYREAEKSRKAHVDSLRKIQDRARETQKLVGLIISDC